MTPEQIVAEWLETDAGPTVLVERIRAYGDARAMRPEWQPIEPKPADWDTEYRVTLTGKNLEAMSYLARFVLDAVRDPHPLPFGVIGAADHLVCLAAALRVR